jgi:hypothetical protein
MDPFLGIPSDMVDCFTWALLPLTIDAHRPRHAVFGSVPVHKDSKYDVWTESVVAAPLSKRRV